MIQRVKIKHEKIKIRGSPLALSYFNIYFKKLLKEIIKYNFAILFLKVYIIYI
jgi:hypothetical protein